MLQEIIKPTIMKLKKHLLIALAVVQTTSVAAQTPAAHFDMSLKNGHITEKVSGQSYTVASQLPSCTVDGLDGNALRFDGYSNYVQAGLPVSTLSTDGQCSSSSRDLSDDESRCGRRHSNLWHHLWQSR